MSKGITSEPKKLPVMRKRCDQCLFTANKIVTDERKTQILAQCQKEKRYFICHKTETACCRGFFDSGLTDSIQIISRLAKAFPEAAKAYIEWVDVAESDNN